MPVDKVLRIPTSDGESTVTFEEQVPEYVTISVSNRKPFAVALSDLKEVVKQYEG